MFNFPCDAAGMELKICDQGGKCLSAASFCRPAKIQRNGGDPQGKEVGRPFLLTLLWRDKRVRRRAGTQPRDLDLDFDLQKNKPAGSGPPAGFIFFVSTKKTEPKESDPNASAR